jgi:hypothetical protein
MEAARPRGKGEGGREAARMKRVLAVSPPLAAGSDVAAIVVFTLIGLLSHDGAVSARALGRDLLPLLGGWFAVALVVRLYARPAAWRLVTTWLVGITGGVAIRAAILGHTRAGKEAAFLGIALTFTALFTLAARLAASVR